MLFVDLVVPTLAGVAAGLAIFFSMLLYCFSSLICHLLHLTGNSPAQWGNYSFAHNLYLDIMVAILVEIIIGIWSNIAYIWFPS